MPEIPDLTLYQTALQRFVVGRKILRIRIASPFVLRTWDPPISAAEGKTVRAIRRVGKQLVWVLDDDLFLVFHLMVAGRYHWKKADAVLTARTGLASFDFDNGSLFLTEASSKKRAALHVIRGEASLAALDAGGLEPLTSTPTDFAATLRLENHTLKRSMTDPRFLAGIGNAYSDEILHRARLSPIQLTAKTTDAEFKRLHEATVEVLTEWIQRLQESNGEKFPEKVTAFRPEMAVHGRYGLPCPRCKSPVQRIVRAENEVNYCPTCQTDGKLLADRALSRLLGEDWPRSLEELDELRARQKA